MRIALLLVLAFGSACRRASPPPSSAPVGNVGGSAGSAGSGSGSASIAACIDECMRMRQMQAMGIDQIRAGCQVECEPQPIPDGP